LRINNHGCHDITTKSRKILKNIFELPSKPLSKSTLAGGAAAGRAALPPGAAGAAERLERLAG